MHAAQQRALRLWEGSWLWQPGDTAELREGGERYKKDERKGHACIRAILKDWVGAGRLGGVES